MPPAYTEYEGADDEAKARRWVEDVLSQELEGESTHEALKSGVALCQLANKLREGAVKKISKLPSPFPQRENVRAFIEAARSLGVPEAELFDTDDLFEARNMRQVMICLASLGRVAHTVDGYDGPTWQKPVNAKAYAGKKDAQYEVKDDALWGKTNGEYVATRHN